VESYVVTYMDPEGKIKALDDPDTDDDVSFWDLVNVMHWLCGPSELYMATLINVLVKRKALLYFKVFTRFQGFKFICFESTHKQKTIMKWKSMTLVAQQQKNVQRGMSGRCV
jgi:hypothetical protein